MAGVYRSWLAVASDLDLRWPPARSHVRSRPRACWSLALAGLTHRIEQIRQQELRPDVLGGRLVHRLHELGDVHLVPVGDVGLDPVGDQGRAEDRPVAPLVVGRGPAPSLLVVPGHLIGLVGGMGVLGEGQPIRRVSGRLVALPVVLARAQDREVGRGALGPLGHPARHVVGDVAGVHVGPVEEEVDLGRRALEAGRPADVVGVVELGEAQRRVRLVEVRRPGMDEGHRLPVDLPPGVHDSVDGPVRGQRLGAGRRRVAHAGCPGVGLGELLHGQAVALVHVVVGVAAQHLGERVGVVRGRGGGTPGVVLAVAQLHVVVYAGEGRAAGVDGRAGAGGGRVDVLLHQDLRDVVPHLGPHHGDRVPVGRMLGRHQLPDGGERGAVGGQRPPRRRRSRHPGRRPRPSCRTGRRLHHP